MRNAVDGRLLHIIRRQVIVLHAAEFLIVTPGRGRIGGQPLSLLPAEFLRLLPALSCRKYGKWNIAKK